MRIATTFLFLLFAAHAAAAQPSAEPPEKTAHEVPAASEGNVIELTVANSTDAVMREVQVAAEDVPAWLNLEGLDRTVGAVGAGEETPVRFRFAIDEDAPIEEVATLRFQISSEEGSLREHAVELRVAAPAEFKLYGNYPNPFSSSGTTIAYDLPDDVHVRIAIYDVLGRRVAMLADETQEAGHQKVRFRGARLASGLYVCRITAGDHTETMRMMLVK